MMQPTTRTIASLTVAAILLVGCTPNESSKDVPGIWTDGVDGLGDGGDGDGNCAGTDPWCPISAACTTGMFLSVQNDPVLSVYAWCSWNCNPQAFDLSMCPAAVANTQTVCLPTSQQDPFQGGCGLACDVNNDGCPEGSACIELQPGTTLCMYDNPNSSGDCAPTPLTSEIPLNIAGNNAGGSMTKTGTCGGSGPEQVYSYVAPVGGLYSINLSSLDFDTVLYVLDGNSCLGTELVCNDDNLGSDSFVEVWLQLGQEILIVADSFGLGGGYYSLSINAL